MSIILITSCDGVSGISITDNLDFLKNSSHLCEKFDPFSYQPDFLYYIESISREFFEDYKSDFLTFESKLTNGVLYYDSYTGLKSVDRISDLEKNLKSRVLSKLEKIYGSTEVNKTFLKKEDVQPEQYYIVFCKSNDV